jgi:3-deoxy-7-phosphoheptulonate synthase
MTNVRISKQSRPLPSFNDLCRSWPLSERSRRLVSKSRQTVNAIVKGDDKRLLIVSGPCSVHDREEVLKVARAIAARKRAHGDQTVFEVMRVCLEKPRTGQGWGGFAYDPLLDGTDNMYMGLTDGRRLMLDILELGVPIACEMLEPSCYNVISDLTCYAWVGARTVSAPNTRKAASGLSVSVGLKNSNNGGGWSEAVNGLDVVKSPQSFAGTDNYGVFSQIYTTGNPLGHIIARGDGHGPNYSKRHLAQARRELVKAGFPTRIMVDSSHGNCAGDYRRQVKVILDLVRRVKAGERGIIGLMAEVYLGEGKQSVRLGRGFKPEMLKPGLSVTDACLSLEQFDAAMAKALVIL